MDNTYFSLSFSFGLESPVGTLKIIACLVYSCFFILPPLVVFVVLFKDDVICTIHYIVMIFVIQMTLVISWFLAYLMSIFPIWKKFQFKTLISWPLPKSIGLRIPFNTYRRLLVLPALGPFSLWRLIFTKSKILAFRHGQVSKGKNIERRISLSIHHFVKNLSCFILKWIKIMNSKNGFKARIIYFMIVIKIVIFKRKG